MGDKQANSTRDDNTDIFNYHLVESVLRVSAEVMEVFSGGDGTPTRTLSDISIELVHRGDTSARKEMLLSGKGATWNVNARNDGSLCSVGNSNSPPGAAVVRIVTGVLRIAGSVAAVVIGRGGGASQSPGTKSYLDVHAPTTEPTVESSLKAAKELAARQRVKLNELRNSIIDNVSVAPSTGQPGVGLVPLAKAERILERSLLGTEKEIDRLISIQQLQQQKLQKTVKYTIERFLSIGDIVEVSEAEANKEPLRSQDGDDVLEREFGLIARRIEHETADDVALPTACSSYVEWRAPRIVDLIFWREVVEGQRRVVKRISVPVVDSSSKRRFFEFDKSRLFHSEDSTLTFGDLGTPQVLGLVRKSGVAAIRDALSESTPAIVETVNSFGATIQARAERRVKAAQQAQADLDAQIALEKSRLELRGINATAADFAELRKIEQAAAIAKARRAIEGSGS